MAEGEVQGVWDVDGASKREDLDKGSICETVHLYLSNHRSVRGEREILVQDDCVTGTGGTEHNITIAIQLAQVTGQGLGTCVLRICPQLTLLRGQVADGCTRVVRCHWERCFYAEECWCFV